MLQDIPVKTFYVWRAGVPATEFPPLATQKPTSMISPVCTHLKCLVQWNAARRRGIARATAAVLASMAG
jgi:hypothetical protein